MYKHWKDAEAAITSMRSKIGPLTEAITAGEAVCRNAETDIDTREAALKKLECDMQKRSKLEEKIQVAEAMRDRLKAAEERQAGLFANIQRGAATAEHEGEVTRSRAYEQAWSRYILTGDAYAVRGLLTSTGHDGILVPDTLVQRIDDAAKQGGRLFALCHKISHKGILRYPIVTKKTDAEPHPESASIAGTPKKEKEVDFGTVTLDPQYIAETFRVTDKFEADSIEAFWTWLNQELPDSLLRAVDRAILLGDSEQSGVQGILTAEAILGKPISKVQAGVMTFNTVNACLAKLEDGAEENVHVIMNRETFYNGVLNLQGKDAHPIFTIMQDNAGKPRNLYGGYPVVFSNLLPSYSSAKNGEVYMLVGNFSAMTMNLPNGFAPEFIRDPYTQAKLNITSYISKLYTAGAITKQDYFVAATK